MVERLERGDSDSEHFYMVDDDSSSESSSIYESDKFSYPVKKPFSYINHWSYRYIILSLVCVIKCVQNYIYEIPSGLENTIIQVTGVDVTRYTLLYSVYSWPNVILPLVGGVFVDRVIGIRAGTLFFMCVSLIGQLGFAFGGYFDSFLVMVVARFVIGIGSQMALVISDAFAARWFKGKEIGLMFALIGIACRLGGIGGLYLSSIIYDCFDFLESNHFRLGSTLLVSFGALLFATATTILLVILDKKGRERVFEANAEDRRRQQLQGCCQWFKSFGIKFWLIGIMFSTYYATIFSFVATCQLFLISKFSLSDKLANTATIVSYAVPFSAPLVGVLIDHSGYYLSWGLFGGLGILFGSHLLLALSGSYFYIPFVGNVLIGISYVCFNTAMRIVPTVLVSENQLVTAFGILESFQSIGYSVTDVGVGVLIDSFGYFIQQVFFLWLLLPGILAGVLLVFCMDSGKANESRFNIRVFGRKKRKA